MDQEQHTGEIPLKESDFRVALDKIIKLAETNPYTTGVIKVLEDEMNAGEQPAKGPLRESELTGITEDEIASVLSWVALKSNFDDLEQVNEFLELRFTQTIDKWNQSQAESPYQGNLGKYSSRYREAKDQVVEALKPYAQEHMLDATTKQLRYWTEAGTLQNGNELVQRYTYGRVDAGHLQIYVWEGAPAEVVHQVFEDSNRIQSLLRDADLPVGLLKPIHVLLVPSGEYMEGGPHGTLGAADGRRGDRMIVRADIKDRDGLIGHEAAHATSAQLIGGYTSVMLSEAFALGVGKIMSPQGSVNDMMYHSGFKESVRRYQAGKDIGITHDQLLENEDKVLSPEEQYAYAYRHAQMFFDFFNETPKYGFKKFIELYKASCADNLFSSSVEDPDHPGQGKPLIENRAKAKNVTEQELVVQVIKKVFKSEYTQVLSELELYYKQRTKEQIDLTQNPPSQ